MKKIFISGASRGIGLAIAKRFYKEGFQVGICSRSISHLAAAKEEMPDLLTFQCDISDKVQVKAMAVEIEAAMGTLEVLVNNGGIFQSGSLMEKEDDTFEAVMATNLNSAYYLSKALLPAMMQAKRGTVVNMCSVASILAYENGGAYCMSKHALLGFGKVLREEMKAYGIRVINVLPGATLTDSWAGSGLPEGRFMPVEDIAEVVWDSYKLSGRTVVEEVILRPFEGDI